MDVSQEESTNINIISHLESERQQELIKNGMSFSVAKNQAQKEILRIFNFDEIDVGVSGELDISKNGDGNSVLLAAFLPVETSIQVKVSSEALLDEENHCERWETTPTFIVRNTKHLNHCLNRWFYD